MNSNFHARNCFLFCGILEYVKHRSRISTREEKKEGKGEEGEGEDKKKTNPFLRVESEVAHPLCDTRTNCSRVSGRKGEVIKRVESKTTGSTGHNAISFLSHPPYRVSLSSPPFTLLHTLPTTYCGSCYLYLFNPIFLSRPPIHLSAPFVRSLIFRRRAGGGRAYKVSRGRRSALRSPLLVFFPARATASGRVVDGIEIEGRGEEEEHTFHAFSASMKRIAVHLAPADRI